MAESRTAISSSFVKAMLSQRPCVSFSILALSGASRQLPQSGSHWRTGQAHARRTKPDISQTGVPCCQDQQQLDKMRLSRAIDPARTAARPRTRRFLSHSVVFRRFYALSHISRFSVILWPFQCIFGAFWCFKNAHFHIFEISSIFQRIHSSSNASYYPVLL